MSFDLISVLICTGCLIIGNVVGYMSCAMMTTSKIADLQSENWQLLKELEELRGSDKSKG